MKRFNFLFSQILFSIRPTWGRSQSHTFASRARFDERHRYARATGGGSLDDKEEPRERSIGQLHTTLRRGQNWRWRSCPVASGAWLIQFVFIANRGSARWDDGAPGKKARGSDSLGRAVCRPAATERRALRRGELVRWSLELSSMW